MPKQAPRRSGDAKRRTAFATRLARAAGRLFTAPFSGDPDLASVPIERRERIRRGALLRLIIVCLLAVQLPVAIPASILNDSPPGAVALQFAIVAFGALCLALNAAGWTTLAGALYIYPPMTVI